MWKANLVPVSTTNWGRIYFRNDEFDPLNTSGHAMNYKEVGPIQVVLMSRWPGPLGLQLGIGPRYMPDGSDSPSSGNPILYLWRLMANKAFLYLPNNLWYRYEWMMEYVTPTSYRLWPRIYNMAGTLLYDANNYYTGNYLNNSDNRSLKQFYDGGGTYGFTLASKAGNNGIAGIEYAREFGLGQEGAGGTTLNGAPFYFAKVALSLTGWIGP